MTFRMDRLPPEIQDVLPQCAGHLSFAPSAKHTRMVLQFVVPDHLFGVIAAMADEFQPVACDPPVLSAPPQELLRAAGGSAIVLSPIP